MTILTPTRKSTLSLAISISPSSFHLEFQHPDYEKHHTDYSLVRARTATNSSARGEQHHRQTCHHRKESHSKRQHHNSDSNLLHRPRQWCWMRHRQQSQFGFEHSGWRQKNPPLRPSCHRHHERRKRTRPRKNHHGDQSQRIRAKIFSED